MKTISTIDELGISVPNVRISRTSLDVLEAAGDQDYGKLEQFLDTVGGSSLWWWGDYLNHLASARGIEYAEAKAASSYSPGALKNAAWVCRHVDRSRRRDLPLTFSHHYEVASMSPTDQEIWLSKAESNGWSQKQLRAEVRQSKATVKNGPEQSPIDQRAARASASFEEFSAWYQSESPSFTPEQRAEWGQAIRPLAVEYLSSCSKQEIEALLAARDEVLETPRG